MDNPISPTPADAPVAPHYSEMFADVCKALARVMEMAKKRNHQGVLKTVRVLDSANRTVYAKMITQTVGDNGEPITESDRVEFVRWMAVESHKLLMQAAITQAIHGNPPDGWEAQG